MSLYERLFLARAIDRVCAASHIADLRRQLIPLARGEVLEIGIGSGHNLEYYDVERVSRVIGIEPSPRLLTRAERRARSAAVKVELIRGHGERLPVSNAVVDTVVLTYTLCSVEDVGRTLAEARRVLRPGGLLVFCEHGLAPQQRVARWQRRLTPLWSLVSGGCHLDRDIPRELAHTAFRAQLLTASYVGDWKPAGYVYRGVAVPE